MTDPKAPAAEAVQEPENAELAQQQSEDDAPQGGDPTQGEDGEGEKKPELTAEQKENAKLKKRIDKLTAQKGDLTRAHQAELAELQAQLEANKGADGEKEDRPLTLDDVEAMAGKRAQELVRQQDLSARAAKVLKTGEKMDGFNAALAALRDELPMLDKRGNVTAFAEALLDSDMAAELIQHLGNEIDEAEELKGLSPAQLGRRIAKLEDKLKRSAIAKKSAAPKPIEPLSGASSAKVDKAKMTDAQYNAWYRQNKAKG